MALTRCCCSRLRAGTRATGIALIVLSVIGGLFTIPKTWLTVAEVESSLQVLRSPETADKVKAHVVSLFKGRSLEDILVDAERGLRILKIQLAVSITVLCLYLIFNSLLIHGERRSAPGFFLPWLVFHAIAFTVCCLASIWWIVLGGLSVSDPLWARVVVMGQKGPILILLGLFALLLSALFWYLWAVVLAYYRELRSSAGGAGKRDVMEEEGPPADNHQQYPPAHQPADKDQQYPPANLPADKDQQYPPAYQPADKHQESPPAYQPADKHQESPPAYHPAEEHQQCPPAYQPSEEHQ